MKAATVAAESTTAWVSLTSSSDTLNFAARIRIADELDRAMTDPEVTSIVLIGSGDIFCTGAEIGELGAPLNEAEPSANTLIGMVESSVKPVIAAINGLASGTGLQLALACHYRIAAAGVKVALPEVKLGLLPGAGATQRLPRLIGAEAALNMILSGDTAAVEEFTGSSLFDELITGDFRRGVEEFIQTVDERGSSSRLARHMDAKMDNADAYFQHARRTVLQSRRNSLAPLKCIDAVAAAVGRPFDETLERQLYAELSSGAQARALRYRVLAERESANIPGVSGAVEARPLQKIGVIGAGTMGIGIVTALLDAKFPVALIEARQEALDRGVATIRKNYEAAVKKGRLSEQLLTERLSRLQPALDYAALGDADLVIEAVFEDLAVKERVFVEMDTAMKPGAILASNTSTLDLDRIAGFTRRPKDVVGLHFFSPANVMRLLEVVRGRDTAPEVLATAMQLAARIKKIAVVSKVCDGFIGNRMFGHYGREAGLLAEEGATPQQIDRALESWGMAMGPFRMHDLAGLDIVHAVRARGYVEHPELRYPRFLDRLCHLGRLGQKSERGWYRYEPGRRDPLPDPEVLDLLQRYRREIGIEARQFRDQEIVERCLYALINEAARLLDEGIAQRFSDVDVVALNGYAFPAHRGGPLFYADEVGLYQVVRTMKRIRRETGDPFWEPAPLLARLSDSYNAFRSLEGR